MDTGEQRVAAVVSGQESFNGMRVGVSHFIKKHQSPHSQVIPLHYCSPNNSKQQPPRHLFPIQSA